MDENHCYALGAYSGQTKSYLSAAKFRRRASALAEVLGRNQGPTELNFCDIDCFSPDGLRGNV
jgi:hypothetical protein